MTTGTDDVWTVRAFDRLPRPLQVVVVIVVFAALPFVVPVVEWVYGAVQRAKPYFR